MSCLWELALQSAGEGGSLMQHLRWSPCTDRHNTVLATALSSPSLAVHIPSTKASTLLQLARHATECPPVLQAA